MKSFKQIGWIIWIFIILYSLCSCQEISEQTQKICGKWENSGNIYEFKENGKLLYNGDTYLYEFPDAETLRVIKKDETLLLSYEQNEDGIKINGVPMFRKEDEQKSFFASAAEFLNRLGESVSEMISGEHA